MEIKMSEALSVLGGIPQYYGRKNFGFFEKFWKAIRLDYKEVQRL